MAYPLDQSFDAGIPAAFASNGGAGGITAAWNESAQAVDLVFTHAQNFWRIDAAEVAGDFWFEIDAEVMAVTYSSTCFGFWLWTGAGTYEGHRLTVWAQQWHHSFWDAHGNQFELTAHAPASWAGTGARRTLRIDVKRGVDGVWQYRISENGDVLWEGYKRHYANFRPSIYGYGLTLRVHRVAGGVPSALPDVPPAHYRALPANVGRTQPVPELAALLRFSHRSFHRLTGTRSHYYAGDHQITGTVKEKGVPDDRPVSRRVLLFDERTYAVVRETWSDAVTGVYRFDRISEVPRYVVIACDHKHNFRAVIADNLRAEPMTEAPT
ncbi:MAG: hypothetical protein DYH17_11505 [Xanthomonadales bacterium PRO6]|nr:hypothetical protein [Xanthomonadales bacterium PRO6]